MSASSAKFVLPQSIEHHLAALCKLYGKEEEQQKREIIVNARIRVIEETSSDSWNGGTYGHALYLTLPETLYLASVRQRDTLQQQIKEDLNKIHNVQNEFIEEVYLEMEPVEDQDWRRDSGLLHTGTREIPPAAANRIWGDKGFRVFLSHKADVKKETAVLKERLNVFGIACFVAHEDIHPTKEWQDEIENALASMDAFVALMTPDFHDSLWTDQEVGFALGRGVPIIAVKLGKDPYGFIGKFQALSCDWSDAPSELVRLLLKCPQMLECYITAVEGCKSWDEGNGLARALPAIEHLSDDHALRLINAYNSNSEVQGSFGFNGSYPSMYGQGLRAHLLRITGLQYSRGLGGKLEMGPSE